MNIAQHYDMSMAGLKTLYLKILQIDKELMLKEYLKNLECFFIFERYILIERIFFILYFINLQLMKTIHPKLQASCCNLKKKNT